VQLTISPSIYFSLCLSIFVSISLLLRSLVCLLSYFSLISKKDISKIHEEVSKQECPKQNLHNVLKLNSLFHNLPRSDKNIHQQTSIYFVMLEFSYQRISILDRIISIHLKQYKFLDFS
jgi:hypothetical protein